MLLSEFFAMKKEKSEFVVYMIVAALGGLTLILSLLYYFIWFKYHRGYPGKFWKRETNMVLVDASTLEAPRDVTSITESKESVQE